MYEFIRLKIRLIVLKGGKAFLERMLTTEKMTGYGACQ